MNNHSLHKKYSLVLLVSIMPFMVISFVCYKAGHIKSPRYGDSTGMVKKIDVIFVKLDVSSHRSDKCVMKLVDMINTQSTSITYVWFLWLIWRYHISNMEHHSSYI